MVIKTISIEEKHVDIIEKRHLSLSKFVQDKLEELDNEQTQEKAN